MTTETKGLTPSAQELKLGKIQYSCHEQLDEYLRTIDNNLPRLPEEGVAFGEVPGLIGFAGKRSRSQVLSILTHTKKNQLIRTGSEDQPSIQRYKREHLLLAAAIVQIRAQGVIQDNISYVLHHYLVDSQLREMIKKPRDIYDPKRKWRNAEIWSRHYLFDDGDRHLLINPGEINLSQETVMRDIPEDFIDLSQPADTTSSLSAHEKPEAGKEPTRLSSERLRWLLVFLRYDSAIKPAQMDTISASRLQLGGFTLEEAESVFEEFYSQNNSNGKLIEDEMTYFALNNAAVEILRKRRKNQQN